MAVFLLVKVPTEKLRTHSNGWSRTATITTDAEAHVDYTKVSVDYVGIAEWRPRSRDWTIVSVGPRPTDAAHPIPSFNRRELAQRRYCGRTNKALASVISFIGCAEVGQPLAADELGHNVRDMKLFRFEFDNDTFVGSDNAFTAGWSVQVHSQPLDEWTPGLADWIGRVPGLRDDGKGGRIARWPWGVTQLIITPDDVTIAAPQPDNAPWAGILGGYVSWSAYDNKRLAALQAYLGCVGPCSGAKEAQRFVHEDLGFGEMPEGWSNQIEDNVLVNRNYEYRRKLWDGRRELRNRSLGTRPLGRNTSRRRQLRRLRVGLDQVPLRLGHTARLHQAPGPPAFGIALDAVYLDPTGPQVVQRSWRPYFNVVARFRSVDEFVATEGGETQNGGRPRRQDPARVSRYLLSLPRRHRSRPEQTWLGEFVVPATLLTACGLSAERERESLDAWVPLVIRDDPSSLGYTAKGTPAGDACGLPLPPLARHYLRSGLNPARSSSVKSFGCSQAAK
jgi:hypothetical protein